MSQPFARPGEINYPLFDRFTVAHLASGVLMERLGARPQTALAMAIGWELMEDALKDVAPGAFPYRSMDSLDNRIGDVIGVMAGWALSRMIPRSR